MKMKDITLNKIIIDLADEWDDLKEIEKNIIARKIAGVRKMCLFKDMMLFVKRSGDTAHIMFDDKTGSYKFSCHVTMQELAKELMLPVGCLKSFIEELTLYGDDTDLFPIIPGQIDKFDDLISWIYNMWDCLDEKEKRLFCSALVAFNETLVTYLGCDNADIDANSLYQAIENTMNDKPDHEYYIVIGELARMWKKSEGFIPYRVDINTLVGTMNNLYEFRREIGENENGK